MTDYIPITAWSEDDRPRERLLKLGAENLSDAELLAILIKTGVQGRSAVDLARQLLDTHKGLEAIARAGIAEITTVKGVGRTKAVTIKAAAEIGRRIANRPPAGQVNFARPAAVFQHFRGKFDGKQEEYFYTLLLNQKNNLIREEMVSKGSLTASVVHPREVLKTAIRESAAAFIAVHNHPSGTVEASAEDLELTRRLKEPAGVVGIRMLDHVIIGRDAYASLFERYAEFR